MPCGPRAARRRLLAVADPGPADACVDLGAGTGFIALALAPLAGSVLAVDISPVMAESLAARAAQAGSRNVTTEVSDLRSFRLTAASVDLVVSRGPAGWWRIAKNLARYGLGVGHEHPAAPQFWQLALPA